MNKRIDELSDQCYYINTYSDKEIFDHKKFAENIIRECLDIIKSNTFGPAGEYDYSYTDKCVAADDRAETIYNEIQQHFGVKE